MNRQTDNQPRVSHRAAGWVIRMLAHLLAILSITALTMVPFVNQTSLTIIVASATRPDFLALTWVDGLLHVGLSACLWALIVIGFQWVTAKRTSVHKLLRVQRGSVMTETLIVLPIFFLLTFGIAQLAINNIAGLLANTAAFQAGRTAWLWSAEADAGRSGVTAQKVERLAHVQAAAVLAPVAAGEFRQEPANLSDEFKAMRGLLVGGQMLSFGDGGKQGKQLADFYMLGARLDNMTPTFYKSFDTSGWRERSAKKLTFAFAASKVRILPQNSEVGVELTYQHYQAMPMVGAIFGDLKHTSSAPAKRPGYYSELVREFTMQKQSIKPNIHVP